MSTAAAFISMGFVPLGRRRFGPKRVAKLFNVILFSEELAATLSGKR